MVFEGTEIDEVSQGVYRVKIAVSKEPMEEKPNRKMENQDSAVAHK